MSITITANVNMPDGKCHKLLMVRDISSQKQLPELLDRAAKNFQAQAGQPIRRIYWKANRQRKNGWNRLAAEGFHEVK